MPPILFATEFAVSRSLPLEAQVANNLFVERQGQGAKSQSPLFGVPGTNQFATTSTAPNRSGGAYNYLGLAYFVQGNALWTVSSSGVATQVGTGILGAGPVSMADNGVQLMIVNGTQGYVYTTGGGLVLVTDPAWLPADTVEFMDGYFIFNRHATNEYFLSQLYDGTTYNALDFASAEAQSGYCLKCVQNLELLFVFTTSHIEIWYDAGTNDFPFQRYAGGVIPYGAASPYAIIKQDGAIFFLGTDKVVYRLQANVPIRVSTHPIETAIDQDANLSVATMMTYTIQGHKMVVLTLPTSQQTLVFDVSTGKWHKRESWNDVEPGPVHPVTYNRWRATSAVEIYQQVLLGDMVDGRIGNLNWSGYMEYGNNIRGLARSVPQHADRKWLFCYQFELDIEAGVGNAVDPGSNPQLMLRYSRDGGRTWSLYQPYRTMGAIGAYQTRLRWQKMGRALQWVWEILITDPVKRTIIAAHAEILPGM